MFERLKEALESFLDSAAPGDERDVTRKMHEAVVEARVALGAMRDALAATEKQLALERRQLADAERRGRMAGEIDDRETVDVAARFSAKHRERVGVLEGKREAQRAELALAQREFEEMRDQLAAARARQPSSGAQARIDSAWRELESAGGVRPDTDVDDDLLRATVDRAAREAAAEEQLRQLKKKMGR